MSAVSRIEESGSVEITVFGEVFPDEFGVPIPESREIDIIFFLSNVIYPLSFICI